MAFVLAFMSVLQANVLNNSELYLSRSDMSRTDVLELDWLESWKSIYLRGGHRSKPVASDCFAERLGIKVKKARLSWSTSESGP